MAVCYLHGNMIPCIACQRYHDRAFPAMPDASTATTEKLAEGLDKLNRTLLMSPPQTEALLAESAARLRELEGENKRLREDKDGAYFERNNVVAALARLYPSGVGRTNIPGWSDDWHGCVYIDLPSGQISYHFHDSQAHLFAGLPAYQGEWDGHDKDTVHARLAALKDKPHA